MNFISKLSVAVATGGYIGKIPFAPGTFGSLPGLLLYWVMAQMHTGYAVLLALAVIAAAVWSAGRAELVMGQKDPGAIVIDEIAGMAVVFVGLPLSWPLAVSGFVLFRIFDIIKPFPVGWLERRFDGGLGVVIDDVAAGLICRVILAAALAVLPAGFG
ncbi:phosphatidylglycerophosphatase A [Desulfosalsimonas propionicica]|uniref:Phosphatidylglycerophosphatase A n=1 Tax=Desulfosalsimonas propionicica TaxID=332175 RepID=A0A7W0C9V2_9BACT|nr:phosphatidylglycerophosphatase A [Desulfosalsimonas propionicica]MBA2881770.1 phosphatidylglycerophosphatase A [Desulfosalsimonas propionicica]